MSGLSSFFSLFFFTLNSQTFFLKGLNRVMSRIPIHVL